MENNNENLKSSYNAAELQMLRIGKYIDIISVSRFNPLAFSQITEFMGMRNYQVMYEATISLWKEVESKCNDAEKDKINSLKRAVGILLKTYSPIIINARGEERVNQIILKTIIKANEDFETQVRESLENHAMNSPNKDGMDMF